VLLVSVPHIRLVVNKCGCGNHGDVYVLDHVFIVILHFATVWHLQFADELVHIPFTVVHTVCVTVLFS